MNFKIPVIVALDKYISLFSNVICYAKQKQPGCKKSARPIRSSIANGHKRPKTLISGKAKKS